MAELFDCSVDNIGLHLKNIYETGELIQEATTENFSAVQTEGERRVNRNLKFYNLDAIISVGYRVNSTRATQFKQWRTSISEVEKYRVIQDRLFKSDFDRFNDGNLIPLDL